MDSEKAPKKCDQIFRANFVCQSVTVSLIIMQWLLCVVIPKGWKCFYCINHLYFLFILIAVTFILHSVLVLSVKQQSYQLHTLYVIAAHALSVSHPWHIVLHSVIVLHVSMFRNLSHCSKWVSLKSIPRPVPVPSWSPSFTVTCCIWCSWSVEHHFSVQYPSKALCLLHLETNGKAG